MTYKKAEHQTHVVFCTRENLQPPKEFITQITKLGYVVEIHPYKKLTAIIKTQKLPEMILAFSHKDCKQLANKVSLISPETTPPIIICLQEPTFLATSQFLSLPPDPAITLPHIRSYLQVRQENKMLKDEIQQLQGRYGELVESVERHKKTGHAAELLKNAIVRNVSHELRTPLLQIKAAVSLIAEDIDSPELVNLAKGATSRLETLVKNITMLGSSLDLKRSPVIVPETIEYAKRNLSRIWNQKDAIERIDVQLPEKLPAVFADKVGLGTVIQLLIDNALKFSDQSVTVIVKRKGEVVEFEVRDNGIGVPDTQLDHIFELFYQIETSTTRKYGGIGVGLALVKLILENHETDIHVRSKVGKGTAFTFQLPIYKW